MTQEGYLAALKLSLSGLAAEEIEEILRDYERHFIDGLAGGRSEGDIASSLGEPRKIAAEFRAAAHLEAVKQESNLENHAPGLAGSPVVQTQKKSNIDTHHRVVAILHMVAGGIAFLGIAGLFLFTRIFSAAVSLPADSWPFNLLLAFGAVIGLVLAIVALAEMLAGWSLLDGNAKAKPWVIAFGIVHMFNIPLGTALGIYTLWALLRETPTTSPL